MYNKKLALSELRKLAKDFDCTFKESKTRLNGGLLYRLVDRRSGTILIDNYQFWTAYNDLCSGYLSNFMKNRGSNK